MTNPGSMARYAYVEGNPTTYEDLYGYAGRNQLRSADLSTSRARGLGDRPAMTNVMRHEETALVEDIHDWWIRLREGSVIRTWGSVLEVDGDLLCFGGRDRSGRFVELCAIPSEAIDCVVAGNGINGLPIECEPPNFADRPETLG